MRSVHVMKFPFRRILGIIVICCIIIFQVDLLELSSYSISLKQSQEWMDEFRCMHIAVNTLNDVLINEPKVARKDQREQAIQRLTMAMLYHRFELLGKGVFSENHLFWKMILSNRVQKYYYDKYKVLLMDIQTFPVPIDVEGGQTIFYEDSWGNARTYGGSRRHEGTDIMTSNNSRGYFPVISISEGVIEQLGWLEKGGYRIGIRSPSGAYFYYAHMCEYAKDLKKGDVVKAGELLGTMGDTGYGKEGTTGQFDVHLHVGIYLDIEGEEISVNPYYILKYLEQSRIEFHRVK